MQNDHDPGVRIARILAGLLFLQLSRIRRRTGAIPPAASDDFSVGYMFGLVDEMTQRVGLAAEGDAARIFFVVAKALFGHETGAILIARFAERGDCAAAMRGDSIGRGDSRAWLADPTTPPLGWCDYCLSAPRAAIRRPS